MDEKGELVTLEQHRAAEEIIDILQAVVGLRNHIDNCHGQRSRRAVSLSADMLEAAAQAMAMSAGVKINEPEEAEKEAEAPADA